jgi:transposase
VLVSVRATGHAEHCCGSAATAERLAAENRDLRATAKRLVAEKDGLAARLADVEGQLAALSKKVATYAKMLFGRSSEKKAKKEDEPSTDPSSPSPADPDGPTQRPKRRRGQQPGAAGHGRRDYSGLPTEEEVRDVAAADRCCPTCTAPYEPFGEETSSQVDWQVRLVRIVHRRLRYRRTCRCAPRGVVVASRVPKPVAKGLFTSGFLARLLTEKFVFGRPLHRIAAALATDGLCVSEGTLAGVMQTLSGHLAPLDAQVRARNAASAHLHIDETSWKVFETVAGKEGYKWWLWVFLGADTTVFRLASDRSSTVLTEHLGIDLASGALEDGRRLLISSDFYSVYQSVSKLDGVDGLWCWAHIRRYFIRAADSHSSLRRWSDEWRERIGALYVAHRAYRASDPGTEDGALAKTQLDGALVEIDTARTSEDRDGLHYAAREVLATLDHEWKGLARHLEFPELDLDNNAAERALRNPVVGRKNYYGSGSVRSAELAGQVWTATATASLAGCNPLVYLTAYLDACAEAGGSPPQGAALRRFLPWNATAADLASWRTPGSGPSP